MSPRIFLTLALALQSSAAKPRGNALPYLTKVIQRYINAKSYRIEATLVRTTANALSRDWQKYLLTAIVAPGDRYRYEGKSGYGSAVFVSNGKKQWIYHPDSHEYTEGTVSPGEPVAHTVYTQEELAVMAAQQLMVGIRTLADGLKSATFLPDEKINLDGRTIDCRVVHFTYADFKFSAPQHLKETVWIDKSRNVIVKTVRRIHSFELIFDSGVRIPIKMKETTTFHVVALDSAGPESAFTFSPPAGAKLVAAFQTMPGGVGWPTTEFVRKPAPAIHLKLGGKDIPLTAFRGKPVLLDFWATWCAPCVAAMPKLKRLYAETHDKGLVWIGIDEDKHSAKMRAFLEAENIPWPNDHDAGGSIGKAFGPHGIPLEVLINASGKVTLWQEGYDDANLRGAVAKLGCGFSGVD